MAQKTRRKKKRSKMLKYRKPRNINIGLILFASIFVYIAIYTVMYFSRDRVSIYEVVYGKNADTTNKTYTALLMRSESVVNADVSGYMNYYVRSGERASVGTTVYTIDESGKIQEYLSGNAEGTLLTDADYEKMRQDISNFTAEYSDLNFSETYNFKIELASTLLECTNMNMINEKLAELGADGAYNYSVNRAAMAGIVEYYSDGYEAKTLSDITMDDFKQENYSRNTVGIGDLIAVGEPAYKIISEEEWNVLIPLTEEEAAARQEDTRMMIKFMEDGTTVSGDFQVVRQNNCIFGQVTLNKYMLKFAGERYTQIQIVEDEVQGLKIPKSAVVYKDFFTIPSEFSSNGGDSDQIGFLKQEVDEEGKVGMQFVSPEIYYSDDLGYYVDDEDFKAGDIIIKNDSAETYTVGAVAPLGGVYNVNSGYCVFRRIEKILESGDYYLIATNTSYGLKVYDHIVIDGSMVKENDVVFR